MVSARHFCVRFFCVLTLSFPLIPVQSAETQSEGAKIYEQRCADCHGKRGQGVKDEFDDPLEGDWSLQKLVRYIEKNMPEDEPGTLSGPESEAVGKYIYDTFYSREARLRNNPLRVELARLTNRQYLNSIGDLVKRFTGDDSEIGNERGLTGNYYNSRNFNRNTKMYERLDKTVHFDFGTKGIEGAATNEHSVQWRGSIIAEETGFYDFVVKTPNGMRLWINDDETPLIDAWVSSGQLIEHRASLRLIGGRAYPLRLDCFRFKDKTNSVALIWKPPHGVEQVIPARNLSPSRTTSTFVIKTPFPADDSSLGYERGVSISKEWDEAATHGALETAAYVVKNLDRLSKSRASDEDRAKKVQDFCNEFVSAALRRPIAEEEKTHFVTRWFPSETKIEEAVKRVVLLALKSPRFLYIGVDPANDSFAVAERLSFALWDSIPDAELEKAARANQLQSFSEVEKQARRMLLDFRTRAKMRYFLQHWLNMNRTDELAKDADLFPGFTPELASDLRASLNIFLDDVVWSESSDYRKLLQADYIFANARISDFYDLKTEPPQNEFVKVPLDPKQRSGVLSHPYLLAAFSYEKTTSPIHRGVFLTRNIVGRALRPPPEAVVFKDSEFDPSLTMREKVTELTKPQSCQSCHSVINPLGFALENFDAVGRWRTEEKGKPINPASEYLTDGGETVQLRNARDVAEFASQSEHSQNAFIEQLFHQIVQQPILAYGPETLETLRQSFIASNFNIQKLTLQIATIAALDGVDNSREKVAQSLSS